MTFVGAREAVPVGYADELYLNGGSVEFVEGSGFDFGDLEGTRPHGKIDEDVEGVIVGDRLGVGLGVKYGEMHGVAVGAYEGIIVGKVGEIVGAIVGDDGL